jgi:hypothetical protein
VSLVSSLASGSAVAAARPTGSAPLFSIPPTTPRATHLASPKASESAFVRSWEMIRPVGSPREEATQPVCIPEAEATLTLPNVVPESVVGEQ